jgi:hypothetical protein
MFQPGPFLSEAGSADSWPRSVRSLTAFSFGYQG